MLIEKVTTNVKRTVLLSFLVQFTNYLLEKKNDEQVETPDDPSNFTPVTVPHLIEMNGYNVEEHMVTTEDGYMLTLHRIPNKNLNESKPAVFLAHCLGCSSAIWVMGDSDDSLAFILADQGYDVWMHNTRGNTYSKNHTHLDSCPNCSEYWDFGLHEQAIFDYSAVIDYVLNNTQSLQLDFIGYSMGTTQYFMLLAEKPDYNTKIRSAYLMGPPAILGQGSKFLKFLANFADEVLPMLGFEHLQNSFSDSPIPMDCLISEMNMEICRNVYSLVTGIDVDDLNPESVPYFINQVPAGAPLKTILHFAQLMINGGQFLKFDYGGDKNIEMYGTENPPEYDLSLVNVPTMMYTGDSDSLIGVEDVELLSKLLPNDKFHVLKNENWGHFDFIFNENRGELVYADILKNLLILDRVL